MGISKLKQAGQSTVEYIMLLAVVMTFTMIVLKSDLFQSLIGGDGVFYLELKHQLEYAYKNGLPPRGAEGVRFPAPANPDYTNLTSHDSYYNGSGSQNNTSRFFLNTTVYP